MLSREKVRKLHWGVDKIGRKRGGYEEHSGRKEGNSGLMGSRLQGSGGLEWH